MDKTVRDDLEALDRCLPRGLDAVYTDVIDMYDSASIDRRSWFLGWPITVAEIDYDHNGPIKSVLIRDRKYEAKIREAVRVFNSKHKQRVTVITK